ncbi:DUF1329 domain-containing protein [Pseudomonas paeninsulae]|uniref:DUF1329 domain-containing protein n=1 Tax=Pseudomonas paeninsulae TaxID=3110772 RepID=UPI002D7717B5|nr:DUF1329 domain-containing protein [Pseudomonas sp. IT1137]
MKLMHTLLATSLAIAIAGQAQAAVSATEASKLGTELTLLGAEMAGNADGSIPAYAGGLTAAPAGFKTGDTKRPDPFADDQPVQVIDGKNADQYQGMLTATTVELLKRFPSYRLDVYPTHRSVVLPQAVLNNTLKNATDAKSIEGGQAIENALPGAPFPIPQSGAEAMWNHLLRYQGVNVEAKYDSWNVDSAGVPTLATTGMAYINYASYNDVTKLVQGQDTFYQIKLLYTEPARRAGEAILVRDAANPLVQARRAWQYLPGVRRVKLAPSLAYDTPNPGSAGAATYDDAFVFLGALDRYEWKLVGKQEMYVPYNTYKLTYLSDPQALTTPNYLNPDLVRWEKHRVWVVEATLKEGYRHIYHKRRFYLDEDSWVALASDQYDARGQLYRGSFAFLSQSYDQQVPDATPHMIYDLVGGSYNITGLVGPYGGIKYSQPLSKSQWSPESLAGTGIR